jgi:phosphoglycerol transferase MdoB-like AlkP superfamily enzyme
MNAKSQRVILDFLTAYLLLTIIYRVDFLASSSKAHNLFNAFHYGSILVGGISDLAVGFALAAILFLIKKTFQKFFPQKLLHLKWRTRIEACILYCLIFTIALIYATHKKTFLILSTGFTIPLLITSLQQGFSLGDYTDFINVTDWILIFSSLLIFFIILCGMQIFNYNSFGFHTLKIMMYSNPLAYMTNDQIENISNKYYWRKDQPNNQQMHSILLTDPSFVNNENNDNREKIYSQQVAAKQWNIVLIILESAGSSYIFKPDQQNQIPMPFLHSLAEKGLWLNNNYSTGNTSPLGGFGIMTGLYSSPSTSHFSVQPNISLPIITDMLDKQYQKSFVTAGISRFYFPERLIKNGFTHFYDGNLIPHAKNRMLSECFLSEKVSADYFITLLDNAKAPFIATYWSGAAHFPYYNYGSPYQIENDIDNPLSRYINNLKLLDKQIQRVYLLLEKKHLLENTIIVIVGDHGDSFGEHDGDGSWMHGSALYQEQIKAPLIFYQPRIFKPQIINEASSSADIVPTLLDAMQIHYNKKLLQGESMLKTSRQRKYVFVYGEENELAAIDKHNFKMQISFSKEHCVVYDLNKDPHELRALNCDRKDQESAIVKFYNYQTHILNQYNNSVILSRESSLKV